MSVAVWHLAISIATPMLTVTLKRMMGDCRSAYRLEAKAALMLATFFPATGNAPPV